MVHEDRDGAAAKPAIAVVGACGHTGRFVVKELVRRGFAPIAIARDAAKLAADAACSGDRCVRRVARTDDEESLARALTGAAAVINCAGPFLDTADAVIAAALRARIPYVDVTAEQESARATFENFAAPATEAGVVVVPAMGFFGGLCDLLVTAAMGDWPRADTVDVAIALDSWRPTLGTRRTGQRNTFARVIVAGGALAPMHDAAPPMTWSFAEPFGVQEMVAVPLTEIILIHRHVRVAELCTYVNTTPLRDLRDPGTPPPVAVDAEGRSSQTFRVETAVRHAGQVRRASVSGGDIYAFTAPLVVEAIARILARGADRRGVFPPGELFDASAFLNALAAEQPTFTFSES